MFGRRKKMRKFYIWIISFLAFSIRFIRGRRSSERLSRHAPVKGTFDFETKRALPRRPCDTFVHLERGKSPFHR